MSSKTACPSALDESIDGLLFQFSFSNKSLVPAWFWRKDAEALSDRKVRKEREKNNNGSVQLIAPKMNTGLLAFVHELEAAGWVMTDALAQERADPKHEGHTYFAVRFMYHRAPLPQPLDPKWEAVVRDICRPALVKFCKEAMWRVRAYRNPLHREGAEGLFGISINCEVRQPLRNDKGERIVRWAKDEQGERVGEQPLPIVPEAYLRLVENRICIE